MGNLLAGIEGYTDLLLPILENAEDRENAFRILEGVSRMNGLLKDLRYYQEALDIRTHVIEAQSVLQKLMPLLADSEVARLRVDSTIRAGMHVKIDERLIRQALLSILRNAFEALPSNHEPVSLRADSIDQGQTFRFRIHSASPIVDPEIRRRLFEPFFTTKSANLGLGLTMARRIFQAHGGDITLSSSELEVGTEFSCTIPRHI
jgi:signal transduction histidine kinase